LRVVRIEEKSPTKAVWRLHHLTDLHAGAPDFAEAEFRERVREIEEDEFARWTMGGDGGDLIMFNDRRYQPTELAPRYRQAVDVRLATLEHLEEMLSPIASKCWGFADGNHEHKMDSKNGGKFGLELCANLGIADKWVDYRGFVHVTFWLTKTQKVPQLIDIQHGWQGGRSSGAFVNQAEKELSMTEADIVLRGHNHKPNGQGFITLGVSNDAAGIARRCRTVINGGSWVWGYRDNLPKPDPDKLSEVEGSLWSERKGFRGQPIGGPLLELTPQRNLNRIASESRPAVVEHKIVQTVQ